MWRVKEFFIWFYTKVFRPKNWSRLPLRMRLSKSYRNSTVKNIKRWIDEMPEEERTKLAKAMKIATEAFAEDGK